MKKIVLIIGSMIALISGLIIIKQAKKPVSTKAYTIGILQTASHPALDAARDGFITVLKEKLGDDVDFVENNAQGSIANAHTIAQQFHADKQFSGFFAIATPAAQAMSAVEKEKPIFIAAVTDPNALGLIHPTTNVCGTKDMIDVKAEVEMLQQLLPDAKTVGLLYASGETNSIALVKQMRQELQALGLTPIDFAVSSEADMPAVVELACRKTDVILAPTDNMVASSISLIASIANKHKKPLIVSDNMLVKFGALAARGVDYKESGKQAARIAYQVLVEGKQPHELPIEQAKSECIFINRQTLQNLGLTIPAAIENHVTIVDSSY
jgi:putative ABC transport system substrate-binding protein